MSHTPVSDNLQSGLVHTEAATHETTIKEIRTHHDGTKRVNLPQRTKPKLSPHDLRTRRREYVPVENVEDTPVLHRITRDVVKVQVTATAFQSEPISYSVNTPLSTEILATHDTSKESHNEHGSKEHEHISNDKNIETSNNEDGVANVGKESKFSEKKRKHSKNKKNGNANSGHGNNNEGNSYTKITSNDSCSSNTSSANTDKENRSAEKNDIKLNSNRLRHNNNNNNNDNDNNNAHRTHNGINDVHKHNENDANEGADSAEKQSEACNKSIVLLAPRELDVTDDSCCWSELDKRIVNVHGTEKEDSHVSNNESSFSEGEEIIIHEYAQHTEEDERAKETVDDMGHSVNPIFVTAPVTQMRSQSEASTLESSHSSEKVVFAEYNVCVEHSTHIIPGNEKESSYTSIGNSSNLVTDNVLENVRTMNSDRHNCTSPNKHNNNNNFDNNKHKSRRSGDINNNTNTNNKFSSNTNQTKNNHGRHQSSNFTSPFTRADKSKFPGAKAVEEDVTSYKVKIFVGLGVVLGVGATIMLLRSIHRLDSAAARASETARGMFQSFKTYYVPYTHSASLSTRKVTLTTADEQRETVARIRERLISSKLKVVKY